MSGKAVYQVLGRDRWAYGQTARQMMSAARAPLYRARSSAGPSSGRLPVRIASRGELNYSDLAAANYQPIAAVPTITLINGVGQGPARNQRVGAKFKQTSVHIRGNLAPIDDTTLDNTYRVAVVYDRRPTGVLPVATDIFNALTPDAHTNIDNEKRFAILYDKTYGFGKRDTTATQAISMSGVVPLNINIHKRLVVEMPTAGALIGDFANGTGAIYLVQLCSGAAVSSPYGNQIRVRCRFVDA